MVGVQFARVEVDVVALVIAHKVVKLLLSGVLGLLEVEAFALIFGRLGAVTLD